MPFLTIVTILSIFRPRSADAFDICGFVQTSQFSSGELRVPGIHRYVRSIVCAAALFMLATSFARAQDPESIASDQGAEVLSETDSACGADSSACSPDSCQCADPCTCAANPPCAGTPLPIFIPKLTPGWQFTASLLYLRPGADNLGWLTITTFLPVQNPQWAVQTLNPQFQPGFSVGARYTFPSAGKDIRVNWEHLRTSDSASVAVSNPNTQWISPFNQTGPSTSEGANEVGVFHLKAAQAQVNFSYDMINLDVGQTVNFGANTQVRLFTGLSYLQLREQLVSTFYNDPNINPVPPVIAVPDPGLQYINLNNTFDLHRRGATLRSERRTKPIAWIQFHRPVEWRGPGRLDAARPVQLHGGLRRQKRRRTD